MKPLNRPPLTRTHGGRNAARIAAGRAGDDAFQPTLARGR